MKKIIAALCGIFVTASAFASTAPLGVYNCEGKSMDTVDNMTLVVSAGSDPSLPARVKFSFNISKPVSDSGWTGTTIAAFGFEGSLSQSSEDKDVSVALLTQKVTLTTTISHWQDPASRPHRYSGSTSFENVTGKFYNYKSAEGTYSFYLNIRNFGSRRSGNSLEIWDVGTSEYPQGYQCRLL